MNELLFFTHAFLVVFFLLIAFLLGKNTLIAFVSICWLFANFFITKQILFCGLQCTASDVYVIGAILGTSILQEFFGKKTAVETVWTSFFLLGLFVSMSTLHLLYQPSSSDIMHESFHRLLQPMPRLAISSFVAFFIVTRLEIALLTRLKRYPIIPFALRSLTATTLVLLVDTLLFAFLGLWGLVQSLFDVCLVSYTIKMIITLLLSPFLSLTKRIAAYKKIV